MNPIKTNIYGIDMFFSGSKKSVMKLIHFLKFFDSKMIKNYDSIEYNIASKASPIYYDYEHCITMKHEEPLEVDIIETLDILNNMRELVPVVIEKLKLNNIEHLGSELYFKKTDSNTKQFNKEMIMFLESLEKNVA